MNPTRVRYALLGVATANAFLLYLDRTCMTTIVHSQSFLQETGLTQAQVGNVLWSFLFAYALGQVPAGWLADRFGPRRMLVVYIALWSLCTALTGLVATLAALIIVRLACGLSEAGAYPASARVVARWFPFGHRARASSVVAFGGRLGNSLAPWLTVAAITALGSWRNVLWIYGAVGLVLLVATHFVFRDDPASHPWANDAERKLIHGDTPPAPAPAYSFPLRSLLRHRSLWLLSLGGFGMNYGWGLLITWLPKYLQVQGLNEADANRYLTIALACGIPGIIFGGWWCDALSRWFGPRWGRRLPIVIGSVIAATAYILCPSFSHPVAIIVACGIVSFATDSAGPAIWSICQDIGQRHTGATLAWANMWGNFGASAVAKLTPLLFAGALQPTDWSLVFWVCAGGFGLLGTCALFVDSTKPLTDSH